MAEHQLALTETLVGDLRRIEFSFEGPRERVPGMIYLPAEDEGPFPLVLIQHPATSSKDDYFVDEPAKAWARLGWACAGIDAPLHGDRDKHDPMGLFREPGRFPEIVAQFAAEVSLAIDLLCEVLPIDRRRLGYVGYSMGSMLGLPAVARDGRFRAAAFCLVGEGGLAGPASGPGSDVPGLKDVAVRIVAKKADELIPRDATQALYDALPGEKDLVWLPGGHFEIGGDVIASAGEWMRRHLKA